MFHHNSLVPVRLSAGIYCYHNATEQYMAVSPVQIVSATSLIPFFGSMMITTGPLMGIKYATRRTPAKTRASVAGTVRSPARPGGMVVIFAAGQMAKSVCRCTKIRVSRNSENRFHSQEN